LIFHQKLFVSAFFARTQCPQIFPTIDASIMTVLPDRADAIRAYRDKGLQTDGGRVRELDAEDARVGGVTHLVMPAAAFCAWTTCPKQGKWI
jgi:hypothetical protein